MDYSINFNLILFHYFEQPTTGPKSEAQVSLKAKGKLISIGGSAIDYQLSPKQGKFQLYKSCIGKTKKSLGGMARNIADCSSKLGINTVLVSAIGTDSQSETIRQFCQKSNIKLVEIAEQGKEEKWGCGKYYAILDHNNNELLGISEMELNEQLTFERVYTQYFKAQEGLRLDSPDRITTQDIIVVDSNIPQNELLKIVQYCSSQFGCLIVYEAKGRKSRRIVTSGAFEYINLLKMNILQKIQIEKVLQERGQTCNINIWVSQKLGCKSLLKSDIKAIVTKGSEDVEIIYRNCQVNNLRVPAPTKVVKTTGAGDTFTGAYCSMLLMGKSDNDALLYARAASKINIESPINQSVISDRLSMQLLDSLVQELKQKYKDI